MVAFRLAPHVARFGQPALRARPVVSASAWVASGHSIHSGPPAAQPLAEVQTALENQLAKLGGDSSLNRALVENELLERAGVLEAKQRLAEMGMHVPSLWTQRVVWGDHDQFQHVNNVHYLRWLESARMNFLAAMAGRLPPEQAANMLRGKGTSFILAGANLRYIRPVVYPDTCIVGNAMRSVNEKRTKAVLEGVVYSVKQKAVVLTAEQVFVSYSYDHLKTEPMDPVVDAVVDEILREGNVAAAKYAHKA